MADDVGTPSGVGTVGDQSAVGFELVILLAWAITSVVLLRRWRGWRPGALDGPAWRPAPAQGMAMAVVIVAAGVVGGSLARVIAGGNGGASASIIGLGALLGQGTAVVIMLALRSRIMTRTECHPGVPGWAVIWGVAGLLVAWPLVQLASIAGSLLQDLLQGGQAPALAHETLRAIGRSGVSLESTLLVFNAVIAAPFVEEVLYRGVLQQTLRSAGAGRAAAIGVIAALFACMHLGDGAVDGPSAWVALPALFVLGVLFGVLYERTGRLAAPIAAHALFNAVNVAAMAGLISS